MTSLPQIRKIVVAFLDEYVKWPKEALLLWRGCVRTPYHDYPSIILELLAERKIYKRNWSNDPAIHSFLIAGGERPRRSHTNHGWDIHHLYDEFGFVPPRTTRIFFPPTNG